MVLWFSAHSVLFLVVLREADFSFLPIFGFRMIYSKVRTYLAKSRLAISFRKLVAGGSWFLRALKSDKVHFYVTQNNSTI